MNLTELNTTRQNSHTFQIITKVTLFAVFLVITVNTICSGQSKGKAVPATIDKNMLISFDAKSNLSSEYTADISHLTFKNQDEATSFFNSYRDNLISFTVDYPKKKVRITLHKEYAPANWGMSEWKTHLLHKSELYRAAKK